MKKRIVNNQFLTRLIIILCLAFIRLDSWLAVNFSSQWSLAVFFDLSASIASLYSFWGSAVKNIEQ